MINNSVNVFAHCPICKKSNKRKNMVLAKIKLGKGVWAGKAHLQCIKKHNKRCKYKFSILEYDETGKFLGEATPI